MLAEHVGRRAIGKCLVEAHALRHLGDDPPVRLRLARQRQEGALARDAALGIGDGAVLLAPGRGRQQHVRRWRRSCRCGARCRRRRTARASSAPRASRAARGSEIAGLVAITQSALISPRSIALEHLHGLEAFALGHVAARSRTGARGRLRPARNSYARRADWRDRRPRARPSRWAGRSARTGPMPGLPMRPVARWTVDDGVDLVGALRRLVHALREAGDGARLGARTA